ncbi:phospholipase effector Tle1 domain-containing protein [Bradyrhizobium sp. USDA 3650]
MTGELASEQPKKRIALFVDGTWNTTKTTRTSGGSAHLPLPLGRIRSTVDLLQRRPWNTGRQQSARRDVRRWDRRHIPRTYQWLVEIYNDGDDIFIFGFSRAKRIGVNALREAPIVRH